MENAKKRFKKVLKNLRALGDKITKNEHVEVASSKPAYTSYGKKSTGLGMKAFEENKRFFDFLNNDL